MTTPLKLCIALGLVACGSDSTPTATPLAPTVSGVFPERAFVGRDVRIEVSGDGTHWADGTTVDFGAGVTVHSVAVASPTSLFAEVTVADVAAPGLADVTVTGADGALVLHAGLDIEPPLHMTNTGTLAQGSIVTVTIANQDFDHPFDTTMTTFGGQFPNIKIAPPPGTTFQGFESASAFEIVADFTIDVDAQPGELVVNNGPRGHEVRFSAGTLAVAARTPIPLTPNTPTAGGAVDRFETVLYEFTPAAAPSITIVTNDVGGFTLLPATGHFENSFSSGPIGAFAEFDPAVLATDKYYLIYGANSFATDAFQVEAIEDSLVQTNETADPNDTAATAQSIQVPALFADGTLSSTRDVDFVTFPVTAADVGKSVRVMTQGDVSTLIDVFADEAGTISLGESQGFAFDDFTSQPIPDGTTAIFVKFSAAGDVDPALPDYLAGIFLDDEGF